MFFLLVSIFPESGNFNVDGVRVCKIVVCIFESQKVIFVFYIKLCIITCIVFPGRVLD